MSATRLDRRTILTTAPAAYVAMRGVPAMAQTPDATPVGDATPDTSGSGFASIAEEMLASINQHFALDDGSDLYQPLHPTQPDDRQYSYLWPFSVLVSGLGARARNLQDEESTADFLSILDALEHYFDAESDPPGYDSYPPSDGGGDKFYDDNQWLGLDFIHAYRLTGDDRWLEKSQVIWDFSMSGWTDEDMGGGIWWKENDFTTKNTCSNGPAAVHAMMIFEETGDQQYLDWAIRIMDWLEQLYDPESGVYFDHLRDDGTIEPTHWTYNAGTPMEAAAMIYRATDDASWLEKAQGLAEASIRNFATEADANGVRTFPATPWFNAVLQRAFGTLAEVDPASGAAYVNELPNLLLRAWSENRTEDGFLPPDWSAGVTTSDPMDLLDQAAVIEIASLAELHGQ